MRTAIDSAGRVVIPKRLRERAGLRAGLALEVRFLDGAVIIEPAPAAVRLKVRGRFLVAEPEEPLLPLTETLVETAIEAVRGGEKNAGE
ncbi:MAG: AbrB/MazE/SpoVT family DNA-binding domain-containing protein [Deltaproteobacteria bacterium]|nr:AbrB/MazE/SpoVT family DNA-binding domain-containing protein [Deltaproteobacteria bacterium]